MFQVLSRSFRRPFATQCFPFALDLQNLPLLNFKTGNLERLPYEHSLACMPRATALRNPLHAGDRSGIHFCYGWQIPWALAPYQYTHVPKQMGVNFTRGAFGRHHRGGDACPPAIEVPRQMFVIRAVKLRNSSFSLRVQVVEKNSSAACTTYNIIFPSEVNLPNKTPTSKVATVLHSVPSSVPPPCRQSH